jgi:hypothetical protein
MGAYAQLTVARRGLTHIYVTVAITRSRDGYPRRDIFHGSPSAKLKGGKFNDMDRSNVQKRLSILLLGIA